MPATILPDLSSRSVIVCKALELGIDELENALQVGSKDAFTIVKSLVTNNESGRPISQKSSQSNLKVEESEEKEESDEYSADV